MHDLFHLEKFVWVDSDWFSLTKWETIPPEIELFAMSHGCPEPYLGDKRLRKYQHKWIAMVQFVNQLEHDNESEI